MINDQLSHKFDFGRYLVDYSNACLDKRITNQYIFKEIVAYANGLVVMERN